MTHATQPGTAPATWTLADLCAVAELGDDAKAVLRPTHSARAYVDALASAGLHADAARVLAFVLPKREGVWWAWVCARRAAGDHPPPAIRAALDAVERWITQPTDENRRHAMQAGEQADFGTPAGAAALAAFFSGGSLAPADAPEVPPGPFLSAKVIAGAVVLAAVAAEPERAAEHFAAFIAQGIDVAARLQLWERV